MKKILHVRILFLLIFGLFNVAPMTKAFVPSYGYGKNSLLLEPQG
ncbi:hypothetical protein [Bacillus sp. OTU530]